MVIFFFNFIKLILLLSLKIYLIGIKKFKKELEE